MKEHILKIIKSKREYTDSGIIEVTHEILATALASDFRTFIVWKDTSCSIVSGHPLRYYCYTDGTEDKEYTIEELFNYFLDNIKE